MCARTAARSTDTLLEATVEALWRQWRAVGAAAAGEPARTQVDPEALCLASLALERSEPRLWVAMADWMLLGAPLISVQRLKNLSDQFPDGRRNLTRLAAAVVGPGKDARWSALISRTGRDRKATVRGRRRSAGPALTAPPALVLRLRAAFSVGVKADLLAFLLGQQFRTSVGAASVSLGYSTPTVFRAFQDLVDAGLVEAAEFKSATEFWLNSVHWHGVLGGPTAVAPWGFWRELLSYACAVVRRTGPEGMSAYALGVSLRELAKQHETGLARAGVLERGRAFPKTPDVAGWDDFHRSLAGRIAAG